MEDARSELIEVPLDSSLFTYSRSNQQQQVRSLHAQPKADGTPSDASRPSYGSVMSRDNRPKCLPVWSLHVQQGTRFAIIPLQLQTEGVVSLDEKELETQIPA
jgi:hypothetical protein